MHDAVIVSAVRTPVGKAPKGALRFTRPDELAALVVREALARAGHVAGSDIDDVVMGCAMPEAEQGLNVARIASLRAGLPVTDGSTSCTVTGTISPANRPASSAARARSWERSAKASCASREIPDCRAWFSATRPVVR